MNVLVLIKPDNERYIVLYNEGQDRDALRALGRWASDPELSFTWYDAATLSNRMREGKHAT